MSSSIKILLRNKPNREGLFPLAIRITKNRKASFIYLKQYIRKDDWDAKNLRVKKTHSNATRLNNLIAKKLSEAHATLIDLQTNENRFNSQKVKQEITKPLRNIRFNDVANMYLKELEENNKFSRLSSDTPRIRHVIRFAKNNNLVFSDIDESFLKAFSTYLKTQRKVSERSIINNLIVTRTLYNRAIRMGLVDKKHYPFGKVKVQIRFPQTEKNGLSIEEVQRLEQAKNLSKEQEHARLVWLFSFYLAGMRVSDVLTIRWGDIYDGRLHYRMKKNNKLISLKLPDKVFSILDHYQRGKQKDRDLIFPDLAGVSLHTPKELLAKTRNATKRLNETLKNLAPTLGIQKKLTMHIARHSFGNISGDSIPIQTLQKLYRHSSITTTIQYQSNFVHREEDEALDKVLNF